MNNEFDIELLGSINYGAAWDLQKQLVEERTNDPALTNKLLLLEHPHTYTLGRHGDESNLIYDEPTRAEKGIELYHVDRGGDITYHGPGQLVGYPILNLEQQYGRGIGRVRSYVYDLEETLIQTMAAFSVHAQRFEGFRGVWVDDQGELKKIAAIGVYVNRKGISSHGFALNVCTDLAFFQGIIPCGIDDHGVTSMELQLERVISVQEVIPQLIETFAAVFGFEIQSEGIPYVYH